MQQPQHNDDDRVDPDVRKDLALFGAVFCALLVWVGPCLLYYGVAQGRYGPFLAFGLAFATILNLRHVLVSSHDAFRLVVGIYDVATYLGWMPNNNQDDNGRRAMVPCETTTTQPDCSLLSSLVMKMTTTSASSSHKNLHPNWSVRFYKRFVHGPAWRHNLLVWHSLGNGLAFVLLHAQFLWPGNHQQHRPRHVWLGRGSMVCLAIGLVSGIGVASDHGTVSEYGGVWSTWGLVSMAACCAVPAVQGWICAVMGNNDNHRVWMWRYAGAMWGSYWGFRVGLLVLDPLLVGNVGGNAAAWLAATWGAAPLGMLVAEVARRRVDKNNNKHNNNNNSIHHANHHQGKEEAKKHC